MRLNLWIVIPLLCLSVSAYAGPDASTSTLLTPSTEGSKLQLNLLSLMHDFGDRNVPREKRQYNHPKRILLGDVLKDYDQVIVISRKSGWQCGKLILMKGEKVTVQEFQCEPSSC